MYYKNYSYWQIRHIVEEWGYKLEKLYLYNEREVHLQDYTDTVQSLEVFKNRSYYLSIPLHVLKNGVYQIAVQYMGQAYTTEYWIRRKN